MICEADFIELSKDFTSQKERLEAQVLECQKQIAEIEIKIAVGDNRRELIEQYVNVEHLTREMVEFLIEKIMVGKRIPGTRNVPIEIHWNFWHTVENSFVYGVAPRKRLDVDDYAFALLSAVRLVPEFFLGMSWKRLDL